MLTTRRTCAHHGFRHLCWCITRLHARFRQVCNQIWVIEEKRVERFSGEFEEYRDILAEQLSQVNA